jgi:C4-dicarboxylate transporter
MILLLIIILIVIQLVLYWLCKKYKWKYVDFIVFAFFIFGNVWLFPKIMMKFYIPDSSEPKCLMPDLAVTISFLALGLSTTLILFCVFAYLRRNEGKDDFLNK